MEPTLTTEPPCSAMYSLVTVLIHDQGATTLTLRARMNCSGLAASIGP